ncbi:MAG: hypothetical protein IJQ80_07050, partial [Clostridia bacterium]|nr:hypothetical protein [Clostridia bacterium]
MAQNHVQQKLSEQDMEKLLQSRKNSQKGQNDNNDNKEKKAAKVNKKEDLSTGTVIFRVICALIAVAYFVLIIFGKYFMDAESVFLRSLNPFSGEENPNTVIRVVGLCILTLSASYVLRFIIGKLTTLKSLTKRTGIAVIELLCNLVKYAAFLI